MATAKDDLLALLALKKQEFKDKRAKDTHAPSKDKRVVQEEVPDQHGASKSCGTFSIRRYTQNLN